MRKIKRILWSILAYTIAYISRIPGGYALFLVISILVNSWTIVSGHFGFLTLALCVELIVSSLLWEILNIKI